MIEFKGALSKKTKKQVARLYQTRMMLFSSLVSLMVFPMIVPFTFYFLKCSLPISFAIAGGAYLLILIVTFFMNSNKDNLESFYIDRLTIEEDGTVSLHRVSGDEEEGLSVRDVVKLIDYGEWYSLRFGGAARLRMYYTCQKDLLTKGTVEEFEALFEGKLVRKMKEERRP